MSSDAARSSRISGFRKYSVSQRRAEVAEVSGLSESRFETWNPESGLLLDQADRMIENVVGVLGTPIGIATNFLVDGRDMLVPMATEEPSVVAAASNLARMTRGTGGFTTSQTDPLMQAQIQLLDVTDPEAARLRLLESTEEISALADSQDPRLVEVGGGVRDIIVRLVPSRRGNYVVVHLVVDVRDAMGANAVNTMAEAVAPRLGEIAGGRPLLRILTNKADRRLTRVRGVFDAELLGGPDVVEDILDAAELAVADPYRAATHNKGIMNGITAVVSATGNDTRAVEAGAHSHAAAQGLYSAMSHYEVDREGNLVGTMELPMPVGLVGGATSVHPAAKTAVSVLGVATAAELASVIMAVGLAQNAAALRALATEGIQRGHMSLHARNVAVTAGAQPHEVDQIVERLVSDGAVRVEHAVELLNELRA
ncbi:hydroxymethylglutaryl-CoA reductase, degradative [Brevibacterium sp. FME17]|uniref:hydroxymethylglutaryl-CoA reductase, degradative n=1 Tax=Brevibacterium sp. FME17 TaxID=2742606 RepID=UPI00186605F6|nr:hydroxymethylglutaryl-CoA reductase, degradative [Brevibacterium sp. FME17]